MFPIGLYLFEILNENSTFLIKYSYYQNYLNNLFKFIFILAHIIWKNVTFSVLPFNIMLSSEGNEVVKKVHVVPLS